MERSRLPYAIIKYHPAGKRKPGHPLKRLIDCYIGTKMGHEAQVSGSIMMMMTVVVVVMVVMYY
jgi:hypothetical protein